MQARRNTSGRHHGLVIALAVWGVLAVSTIVEETQGRPQADESSLLLALPLWLLILLAASSVAKQLATLRVAGERRTVLWLVGIVSLAGLLRLSLGFPFPANFAEMDRITLTNETDFAILPLLAVPFRSLTSDLLSLQIGVNAVLSVGAAALAFGLGTVARGRTTGIVAGLVVATHPVLIQFARTSNAAVAGATLALAAFLATETWLRTRHKPGGLAAGFLWALVLHVRPEMLLLAAVPLLWLVADPRMRRLRPRSHTLLQFAVPVLLSVVLAVAWRLSGAGFSQGASLFSAEYWHDVLTNHWTGFLDPRTHAPWLALLAVAGVFVWRRPMGMLLLLAGFVVPLLAVSFGGVVGAPDTNSASNLRYLVPAYSLSSVLAAAPVAALLDTRWARAPIFRAGGVVALALIVCAPLMYLDRLTIPSPLQVEHGFLSRHAADLPSGARVLLYGGRAPHAGAPRQVAHYLRTPDGEHLPVIGIPDDVFPSPDSLNAPGFTAERPIFYYRGWTEHDAEDMPREELPLLEWRASFLERWSFAPVACEIHPTTPTPSHRDGLMEVALFRLVPKARIDEGLPTDPSWTCEEMAAAHRQTDSE